MTPELIGTTSFFLAIGAGALLLWNLLRCRHPWELADKAELPPPIEAWTKNISSPPTWDGMTERLCKRTLILAWRCPKCGATKIIKEKG